MREAVSEVGILNGSYPTLAHRLPQDARDAHDAFRRTYEALEQEFALGRLQTLNPEVIRRDPQALYRSSVEDRAEMARKSAASALDLPDQSRPKEKPDQSDWRDRSEPTQFGGTRTYRTSGPIRVVHRTDSVHLDRLAYDVRWYPLDEDGRRLPQIFGPDGHQPAPFTLNGRRHPNVDSGAWTRAGSSARVFEPPFHNAHGWEVDVIIPPQRPENGNTMGSYIDAYLPRR